MPRGLPDPELRADAGPLLPRPATGRPRVDDRRVLNGIIFKIRTGVAWRDLPDRYGPWQTCATRFRRWAADGTFAHLLTQVQARADAAGLLDWLVAIDSTIVRAHQSAAGAGGKGGILAGTHRTTTPSGGPEVG